MRDEENPSPLVLEFSGCTHYPISINMAENETEGWLVESKMEAGELWEMLNLNLPV
jgi:hypothetical protein